jgi:hypothetical protein
MKKRSEKHILKQEPWFLLVIITLGIFLASCTRVVYVDELDRGTDYIMSLDIPYNRPAVRIYPHAGSFYEGKNVIYNQDIMKWRSNDQYLTPFAVPINEVIKVREHNRLYGTLTGFITGYVIGYAFHNLGFYDQTSKPLGNLFNTEFSTATGILFAVGGYISGMPVTYHFKRKQQEETKFEDFELRTKN